MKEKPSKVKVVQDDAEPIERPVLAKAIMDISSAFNHLRRSGLNRRALEVLVHDLSGVGKPAVRAVLSSLEQLEREYTA